MRRLLIESKDFNSEFNRLSKKYGVYIKDAFMSVPKYAEKAERCGGVDDDTIIWTVLRSLNKICPDYKSMDYASSYLEWFLRNWLPTGVGLYDPYIDDIRSALRMYDDIKSKGKCKDVGLDPNIQSYSADSLIKAVKRLNGVGGLKGMSTVYKKLSGLGKNSAEEIYNDGESCVWAVKTWEANRILGANTSWCTVANFCYFSHYGGHYYIVCKCDEYGGPLLDDDRIQCHFIDYDIEENMDVYDMDAYEDGDMYAMDVNDNEVDESYIAETFGSEVIEALRDEQISGYYHDAVVNRNSRLEGQLPYVISNINKHMSSKGYQFTFSDLMRMIESADESFAGLSLKDVYIDSSCFGVSMMFGNQHNSKFFFTMEPSGIGSYNLEFCVKDCEGDIIIDKSISLDTELDSLRDYLERRFNYRNGR